MLRPALLPAVTPGRFPLPGAFGLGRWLAAFVFAFSFVAAAVVPLDEALDQPDLEVATTGAVPWAGQTGVTSDGVDAAQSGKIKDGEKSTMTITVTGVERFSFRWKVSSEKKRDSVRFYIDDRLKAELSGAPRIEAGAVSFARSVIRSNWSWCCMCSLSRSGDWPV
jgi:hypothetical protein